MEQTANPVNAEYLEMSAAFVAPAKRLSYQQMELRPGAKVLDVGCGIGIDTLELVRHVGPNGHVYGVDNDDEKLAVATDRATRWGLTSRVNHDHGDAADLKSLSEAPFDAVRCERLLLNVPNPAKVMAEMARVTRVGGRVVALETDFGSFSVNTDQPDTAIRLARTLAEKNVKNGYAGRQLLGLMMNHPGLGEVSVTLVPLCCTEYEQWRAIFIMDVVENTAVETGVITQEALDQWHAEMLERDASGSFFSSVSMILAVAVRRS